MLTGDLPDDEFQFHATAIYATGGMILSGDDLTKLPPARLAMLQEAAAADRRGGASSTTITLRVGT